MYSQAASGVIERAELFSKFKGLHTLASLFSFSHREVYLFESFRKYL